MLASQQPSGRLVLAKATTDSSIRQSSYQRVRPSNLATIAIFADLKNNPAETFICFEQNKALAFTPTWNG